MSLGYVPPPPILDYVLKNLRLGRLPNWRNREFVLFTLFCSQSIAWALRSHHWFHSIAPVNIHSGTKNHWNHYHHLHYPHNRFPEDLLKSGMEHHRWSGRFVPNACRAWPLVRNWSGITNNFLCTTKLPPLWPCSSPSLTSSSSSWSWSHLRPGLWCSCPPATAASHQGCTCWTIRLW